jgi:hypothetical protein
LKEFLTDEATTQIARKRVNEIALKLTLPRNEDQILLRALRLKIYNSTRVRWMKEEDEMLLQMLRENNTLEDIAVVIDWRTYSAIENRAHKLSTK